MPACLVGLGCLSVCLVGWPGWDSCIGCPPCPPPQWILQKKPAPKKKPAAPAKKAKKDGVKRPLSSYMLFAKSVRPQVVAQNPSEWTEWRERVAGAYAG